MNGDDTDCNVLTIDVWIVVMLTEMFSWHADCLIVTVLHGENNQRVKWLDWINGCDSLSDREALTARETNLYLLNHSLQGHNSGKLNAIYKKDLEE